MSTTWLRSRTYGVGNLVLYNDAQFISLQNNNLNHIPPSSSTWWQGSQSITALQAGAGISINPSVPSVPVVSTNLTVTGGTGINVSETSAGPNNRTWTVASTGSGGVASVSAGPGLTNTGTTTNPVLENTGVYSVNATPGGYLAQSGSATNVLLANNGVCALSSTGAGLTISGTPQLPILANTGVTSVSTGTGLSGGGTGAVALVNTGVTSTNATPGLGLYLSGASTGDVVLNNHTQSLFYEAAGSYTFTAAAPCVVVFTLAGGGGGGGSGVYYYVSGNSPNAKGGGGGASGQIVSGSVMLSTGDLISMVVGGPGAGDATNTEGHQGGLGGDTTLQVGSNGALIWLAKGGTGGFSALDSRTAGSGGDPYSTGSPLSYGTLVGFGGGGGGMADKGNTGYAGNPGYNVPTSASTPPGSGSYVTNNPGAVASGGDGGTGTSGGIPSQISGGVYWIAGGGGGGGPFASQGVAYTSPSGGTPVVIPVTPASKGCGGGGGGCFVNATGTDAQAYPGLTGGRGYISLLISYVNV